ncbi:hypothetical protein Tco_1454404, partial [Tanacetum coccineum]
MDDDLFTYDTPLGMTFDEFNQLSRMNDDLFTYEVVVPELSFTPSVNQAVDGLMNDNLNVYEPRVCYDYNEGIYAEAVIFVNKRLVRLMYMTIEQWLDLIYSDHAKVDKKIKEEVVHGVDADIEYDPSNVDFAQWLASKFSNHNTMDWYTKNALWIYWTRGDDEGVSSDYECSDLEDDNPCEEDEIAQIFRIDTDIFHFKTPLCKEFNYLLTVDTDLFTHDIPRFKTYEEYKNAWLYEWNNVIPWVPEEPWSENGVPHEEWYGDLVDGKLKEDALKQKSIYEGSWGNATRGLNTAYPGLRIWRIDLPVPF